METKTLEIAISSFHPETDGQHLEWLKTSLAEHAGIRSVDVDPDHTRFFIEYDPLLISIDDIERRAKDVGVECEKRFEHETLKITGLDCADCALTVEKTVSNLPGILHVSVNFASASLNLEYEKEKIGRARIIGKIEELGYGVSLETASLAVSTFDISGMDCVDCAATLKQTLSTTTGVSEVDLSFAIGKLTAKYDPAVLTTNKLVSIIESIGYGATLVSEELEKPMERPFWQRNRKAILTIASGISLAVGAITSLFGAPTITSNVFYALAMILGGFYVVRAGFASLKNFSFDMNFLMSTAAIGAAAIGEWAEGGTAIFLFSLGNTLESYTMDRARGAIRSLVALSPNEATVIRNNNEIKLPIREVRVGDIVVVKPGEKIPVDGQVIGGGSTVNQAPITGESLPVEKISGDEVFAGSINERGSLEVQATKRFEDNTLSRIIHLVEEAQAQRAPSQQFVDRFSRYYTPAVIGLAVLISIIPPLFFGAPFETWFFRALVLLVIACPCALVISTPVSIVSAIGAAARNGVLIKGGIYLEEAGSLQAVAWDKTGTLTEGRPEVTDIIPLNGRNKDEVLRLAMAIEARSEHPLAAAILRHGKHKGASFDEIQDFEAITGRGASARLNGSVYYVGNEKLFEDMGLTLGLMATRVETLQSEGKTVILVGTSREVIGLIAVADRIRDTAVSAIEKLKKAGVQHIVMLTGDNRRTAAAIAGKLGIREFEAELLPEDKVTAIKRLSEEYRKVGMIGDGVNDAPALATSAVGVAIGAAATNVALETADIALMSDDLTKVSYAIGLSKKTLAIIKQNITLSLVIKGTFLLLAIPGWVTLWLAIAADMGASLAVTLNGMRLLRYKD